MPVLAMNAFFIKAVEVSYSFEPYTIRASKDYTLEDPSAPLYDPKLPGGGLDPKLLQSPYLQYLYPDRAKGSDGNAFDRAADAEKKDPWAASMFNRAAIRTFSRGVLGAAFYAYGQNRVAKELREYHYAIPLKNLPRMRTELCEAHYEIDSFQFTPLRYLARFIDATYGNIMHGGFYHAAKITHRNNVESKAKNIADSWTTFRDKVDFARQDVLSQALDANEITHAVAHRIRRTKGRSVGNELVSMTFDFAMGSVGDATGREIASWVDPNHPKTWINNGKWNYSEFGKHLLNTGWKILTYNQMEDWFAGIPYIYQMQFQRQILNHGWRGFKQTADKQLNGGGLLGVMAQNESGEYMFKPTMSYALPGLIDLQFRFTGYNWYTLMFRDGHQKFTDAWEKWQDSGYRADGLPKLQMDKPLGNTIDSVGGFARYMLKSLVKSTIYMTPAVPFFWAFRTPQTKDQQLYLYYDDQNPDRAGIRSLQEAGKGTHVHEGSRPGKSFDFSKKTQQKYGYFIEKNVEKTVGRNTEIIESIHGLDGPMQDEKIYHVRPETYVYRHNGRSYQMLMEDGKVTQKYITPQWAKAHVPFGAFEREGLVGFTDRILNPLGKLCYDFGSQLHEVNQSLFGKRAFSEKQVRTYAKAAMAYTPYMYAKGETAIRFDNPAMDAGIYRLIDGVFGLDGAKIRSGATTIRNLITHPPYELVDIASRTQTGLAETRKKIAKKIEQGNVNGKNGAESNEVAQQQAPSSAVSQVTRDNKLAAQASMHLGREVMFVS